MRFFKKRSRTIDFTKVPVAQARPVGKMPVSGDVVDLRGVQKTGEGVGVGGGSGGSGSVMDFLNSGSSGSTPSSSVAVGNDVIELKRMLRATSSRIEDNSNELYRILRKLELLEKKVERLEGGR